KNWDWDRFRLSKTRSRLATERSYGGERRFVTHRLRLRLMTGKPCSVDVGSLRSATFESWTTTQHRSDGLPRLGAKLPLSRCRSQNEPWCLASAGFLSHTSANTGSTFARALWHRHEESRRGWSEQTQ